MYLIEQLRYINGPDKFGFFSNQVEIIAYTTKK